MKKKPIKIVLHVPPAHLLHIYIWPTLRRLRSECKKRGGIDETKQGGLILLGFFCSRGARMTWRGRVLTRVVGEIHLAQGNFGIGTFTHELQHFLSHWFTIKRFDLTGKDWERASVLADRLQTEFWKKFYKLGLE